MQAQNLAVHVGSQLELHRPRKKRGGYTRKKGRNIPHNYYGGSVAIYVRILWWRLKMGHTFCCGH